MTKPIEEIQRNLQRTYKSLKHAENKLEEGQKISAGLTGLEKELPDLFSNLKELKSLTHYNYDAKELSQQQKELIETVRNGTFDKTIRDLHQKIYSVRESSDRLKTIRSLREMIEELLLLVFYRTEVPQLGTTTNGQSFPFVSQIITIYKTMWPLMAAVEDSIEQSKILPQYNPLMSIYQIMKIDTSGIHVPSRYSDKTGALYQAIDYMWNNQDKMLGTNCDPIIGEFIELRSSYIYFLENPIPWMIGPDVKPYMTYLNGLEKIATGGSLMFVAILNFLGSQASCS